MILIMKDKDVKRAKKIGGSVVLSLTGFIRENCFYKVVKNDREEVIIKRIEV